MTPPARRGRTSPGTPAAPGSCCGAWLHERVVQAMTNRSLERLVQDPAPTHAVELAAVRTRAPPRPGGPLLHNRRIEAAELRHMKQRPRALERRRRRSGAAADSAASERRSDSGPPKESCRAAWSSAARSNSRRTARYPRSVTVRSRAGTRSGRSSI